MQSEYSIAIPKDDNGYTHRVCPSCKFRFGIRTEEKDFPDLLTCVYCGEENELSQYNTEEQIEYATQEAKNQIFYDVQKDLQAMMTKTFRGNKSVTFKPGRISRKHTFPPQQSQIPTDMQCSSCMGQYVIFGIAAQCPYCNTEDIKILDANLNTIEKEIESSRELRRAYNDLVIAFQNECRYYAKDSTTPNFQNIDASYKYFTNTFNIDLFDDVDESSRLSLRTVFQKRHTEQHSGGLYDQKYVTNLNLSEDLIGVKVSYSKDELRSALSAFAIISNNLRHKLGHSQYLR